MSHKLWGHEEAATRKTIRGAVKGFVECLLWQSTDDNGEPLDDRYTTSDIHPKCIEEIEQEVYDFLNSCWEEGKDLSAIEPAQFGHDFCLTRNRHGAGFWDRGLGELGDWLTEMSHPYGEMNLYEGHDGKLWV